MEMYQDEDYEGMEELLSGKKKRPDLVSEIQAMEDDSYTSPGGFQASRFLPSSVIDARSTSTSKKKNKEQSIDEWFNELSEYESLKVEKHRGNSKFGSGSIESFLEESMGKRKKKKKKDKDKKELTDYKKEFEPEMALYRNLLKDQEQFTADLQREYNAIMASKSSSRGITKQITDLTKNITEARQLAMMLVEKHVNVKKLISELSLKEKKEMGELDGEGKNMADFASSYLQKMFNDRQSVLSVGDDTSVAEYENEDDLFEGLEEAFEEGLSEDEKQHAETDLYLKYEKRNVTIYVVIYDNDVENYTFLAKDEEGNPIDDYPMPNHTKISVNRSTNIATDVYGQKFPIIWY